MRAFEPQDIRVQISCVAEADFFHELLDRGCWPVFVCTPVFAVVGISNIDDSGRHFVRLSLFFFGSSFFLRSSGEWEEEAAGKLDLICFGNFNDSFFRQRNPGSC